MYQNNHSQKKYFIKFLFVFLLCFSFLKGVQAEIRSSTEESAFHSVWKISNSFIRGTAFAINPNQIITNFHVLAGLLENEGSIEDIFLYQLGNSYPIKIRKVIKVSALLDLALLETKETVSNYLKFTNDFLDPKEKLFIVGYRKSLLTIVQKTENISQMDSLSYFPVNTVNFSGLSGSPVLNIKSEVVGVAYSGVPNLFYFTKVSDIQRFLSEKESTPCSSLPPVKCLKQEIMNLKQMAEEGSALAQYQLGIIYRDRAEKGSVIVQDELGVIRDGDSFVRVNLASSFYWMKKSADQGLTVAEMELAYKYSQGIGTAVNKALAFELLKKSAKRGYAPSQYRLAYMYEKGVETAAVVNKYLAFEWYKKSAEQGFAPAEYELAVMYRDGVGTVVNKYLALYLLKKSAEQGFAPAEYELAVMYRDGVGTVVNKYLALYLLKKSADQGYAPAQDDLAADEKRCLKLFKSKK